MNVRYLLFAALLLSFVPGAHADIITYNLTPSTANTLNSLGTKFLLGCVAIAAAIVLAAFIKRRR